MKVASKKLNSTDILALLLCGVAFLATSFIGKNVYEGIPHIEDEIAYVWQAEAIAGGNLLLPTPECPKCFLVPFVVDANGWRSSKYPPGWPVVLSFGILLGKRSLVPPLLASLTIWLMYRLGNKFLDKRTALLSVFLTITSPFFLMNASSLLSHNWCLFLSLSFTICWLDTFNKNRTIPHWITILTGALSLGAMALTRPLTAVGVAFPFFIHGIILLFGRNRQDKIRVLLIGLIAGLISLLFFVWQFAVTGNFFTNPYTLWWPYDRMGFGPGVGLQENGFTLYAGWINTRFSLWVGWHDFLGWPYVSWLFLPFGLLALRHSRQAWLVNSVFPSLVAAYMFYWIGAWLLGPRYYYESIHCFMFLTSAGICWLAGKPNQSPMSRLRRLTVTALVSLLLVTNILIYTPIRVGSLYGLYGAYRYRLEPFLTPEAQKLTPALVIVHPQEDWIEYGTLLELSNPYHNTPFVFIYNRGEENNQLVIQKFAGRSIFHYYPDEPYRFYTAPRPQSDS